MKKKNQLILTFVGVLALVTSGCVNLWQDNLDIKTYVINASRDQPAAEKPLADKLWIDTVVVLPPGNSRNLILKKSDVEYETSYYTELLMSPSENFRNIFYTWFSGSGLFSDVTLADRSEMTHRLAVSVINFYGDTVEKKAVLKIKVTLFDENTRGIRVLSSKDYLQEIDVADTSADALIRAYDRAIKKILSDCEIELISALKKSAAVK
ncbi:ABC-type transport auxiliary lipoprotein family protein [Pontiellaceae bacterium B1224]|nr:ABC-type transport auxiliary lipoprotein family protein [Pontiellaceae bacterium B1224]